MKRVLLIILIVILFAGTVIGIHSIFNGGIAQWSADIDRLGFFKALGKFFSEIWYGFKTSVGW